MPGSNKPMLHVGWTTRCHSLDTYACHLEHLTVISVYALAVSAAPDVRELLCPDQNAQTNDRSNERQPNALDTEL